MKLIFEKTTLSILSLASVLLVVVLAVFWFNARDVKSSGGMVGQTEEVLRKSNEVLLDIVVVESGSRGFVLTGDEAFLETFQGFEEKISGNLTALKLLTKDNPSQQIRVDSMLETGRTRGIEIAEAIEARQKNQLSEAAKKEYVQKALFMTAKIKSRIADFNAEEFRLLAERKLENVKHARISDWLFAAFIACVLLIFGLFAVILINQQTKNRIAAEQKRTTEIFSNQLNDAKTAAERAALIAEAAKTEAEAATQIAEAATEFAENAMKAKQQFLSNMSHEIRTPMNAIIGFTKVVMRTDLSAKQVEYLTAIKLSGDALIVLINDILDLAKVDAGKMTFEKVPFKMAASVAAMLHVFEPKIQEKNLRLVNNYDLKIPENLLGDPVRLHQVILNLLSNAIKFTERGGITVSVQMLEENSERATIEFSVKDTGIGIAADKMQTIFENFQQASSGTARLFGGTGLGLAIVKQLVEGQGGSIRVSSKLGEGSVFSFTLDFQKTVATTLLPAENAPFVPETGPLKVLVVEDMPLNQLLMRRTILEDFGFECTIAGNGKIGIEKLQAAEFDLILMDLQMPEMNGFEATEHIRNTLKLKTPIIALTADVTTADLEKCTAVGMDDYLSKPIDEKLLFQKITELVKK